MKNGSTQGIGKVIAASSVGTLIEWYDFYIFGMLATILSKQFFPEDQGTSALLSTLAIFAAGFIVRPFGALVFGRLGDLIGRKYTFLLTLILMGTSTFAIGLVPGFSSIGWAAPVIVLLLRLIQGLALGGEYGGAATYVAEHAPPGKRGFYTSWIQTTATFGLFLALMVIILIRESQGVEKFSSEWGGWRYPFWISIFLVGVSVYIRLKMKESPMFTRLKTEGKVSTNPLKESFTKKSNLKMVLLALFGAVMGQGVIWYTGQFYAQNFIENVCKVNFVESRNILVISIVFATPFFILFGWLSDKVGRKWIMLIGMLLGIITYRPIYKKFMEWTNPALKTHQVDISKTMTSVPFATVDEKTRKKIFITSIYDTAYMDGAVYKYTKTDTLYLPDEFTDPSATSVAYVSSRSTNVSDEVPTTVLDTAVAQLKTLEGDTLAARMIYVESERKSVRPSVVVEKTLGNNTFWWFVFWVFIQIIYVTMVYGPIAAFLVELFPTKIRYTSMSLPYHIGNGVFGGLVPFLGALIVEYTKGDPLAGLWYPIGIASLCFVIGAIYLNNKIDTNVQD